MDNAGKNAYDVVIIGAGVSGLSAAYQLKKKNRNITVTVLEAKGRVGGRTLGHTLKTASGHATWDLGGQWVGRTQDDVMRLMSELGLEVYPQYITGTKFMQFGKNGGISNYSSTIPSLPFFSLLETNRLLSILEKWRKEVPVENPMLCENAEKWNGTTLETFKNSICWTTATKELLDSAVRLSYGVESSQISLLYFLFYANAAGGFSRLFEATRGCGQEFKVKGGAFQIADRLLDVIGKENVRLNTAVAKVDQTSLSDVIVTTTENKVFTCKYVIMAIPPQHAGNILYTPCPPANKQWLFRHMPMAHLGKFVMTYRTAFWREKGYSGEIVGNGGQPLDNCGKAGPIEIVFDATDGEGNSALVGFFGADSGIYWSGKTREERKKYVCQHLSQFFGEESIHPLDYGEKLWHEEPYTGGCPISVPSVGSMNHLCNALREPHLHIHMAGTESATAWCGFINGAIQTGTRAALEVLNHLQPSLVTAEELNSTIYKPSAKLSQKWQKKLQEKSRKQRKMRYLLAFTAAAAGFTALSVFVYIKHKK